jgi:hypothetical protein
MHEREIRKFQDQLRELKSRLPTGGRDEEVMDKFQQLSNNESAIMESFPQVSEQRKALQAISYNENVLLRAGVWDAYIQWRSIQEEKKKLLDSL